jgi:ferredoxin
VAAWPPASIDEGDLDPLGRSWKVARHPGCGVLLREEIDDDFSSGGLAESFGEVVSPPRRQLPHRRKIRAHLEAVVGNWIVPSHEAEQARDDHNSPPRNRRKRGRVEVVPDDSRVALPCRECRRSRQRRVGGLRSHQVGAFHPEQSFASATGRAESFDNGEALGRERPERAIAGVPTIIRMATFAVTRLFRIQRLALRGREQEDWNKVRETAGSGGHAVTLASKVSRMRVHLDTEKCQGHNRCYALAPELFDVDDYGEAMLIGDGSVPTELEDKARLAASNCPEYAITITD